MIKLKNIYKKYPPDVVALNNINLEINKGDFVAVMGQSGSGKSTLMHILGLLDNPTSGSYQFNNKDVSKLTKRELAKKRNKNIGFVFQSFFLLPRLTALRNVEMPMFYASIPKQERIERAENLLKKVGLGNRIFHDPSKLSGGEKQRVAIARALANQPELLLADEPTGNLDSHSGKEIMEIFCNLHKLGTTVILITHDPHIASFSKRTIKFYDGKILEN